MDSYRVECLVTTNTHTGETREDLLKEMEINVREALYDIEEVKTVRQVNIKFVLKKKKD